MTDTFRQQVVQILSDPLNLPVEFLDYLLQYAALNPVAVASVRAPTINSTGLTGATKASRYVGATTSGPPATGAFVDGDWIIAKNAHVWICTVAGSPGTWVDVGTGGGSGGTGLTPTSVKTNNYTAAAGDFVPVDTTARNVTITLPNAPADKSVVAVKLVSQSIANNLRVNCAGSDVYNKAGGPTAEFLLTEEQTILVQYQAAGAIWYVLSNSLPARATGLNDPFIKLFPTAGGSQVGIDMESGSGWADAIRLPNNVPLRAYNSGATAKDVAKLDSGNILTLGDTTTPLDIVTDTSTGMRIGTSTSQKLAAYNTTPVVQPTTAGAAATFAANAGTAVNDASTFDGYTIPQIVKALRNLGWLA